MAVLFFVITLLQGFSIISTKQNYMQYLTEPAIFFTNYTLKPLLLKILDKADTLSDGDLPLIKTATAMAYVLITL